MAEKQKRKLQFTRKQIVSGVLVVGALTVAVGAGIVVRLTQQQPHKDDGTNFSSSTSGLPQAIDKAQNQALIGNEADAHKTIDKALKETSDAKEKRELYLQQGITYENNQQYDQALASYREAEKLGLTSTIAERIAVVAEAQKNNTLAVDYYKKAIELLDKDGILYKATKEDYEQRIRNLGGQP